MRLFRRRRWADPSGPEGDPSTGPVTSSPADRADDLDWRTYDAIAEVYARVHAPRTALPARDLVQVANVPAGGRVLDVGTGTGVAARAALQTGASLAVGVDPSLNMLAVAHRDGGGARYAAAEAIDLPFRAETFDAVLAVFALSHFARVDTALFDLMRVLRSGGRMGVTAWGPGEDEFTKAWNEVAEQFAEHEILQDAYLQVMPSAERFTDPANVKKALHEAGVRDIRVERREYRFEMTAEDYLAGRDAASTGRFLHQMLGEELWDTFRRRTRDVFAERFPPEFKDFREVILAAGRKP